MSCVFFFIFPCLFIKTVNDDFYLHNLSSFLPKKFCVAVVVDRICDNYLLTAGYMEVQKVTTA